MDAYLADDFTHIIVLAESIFSRVSTEIDSTPERSILRLEAHYGSYHIWVTELVDASTRKYRYYVLNQNRVEAGFDNSPDPRALRLKYGRIGEEHARELIPHLHLENKTRLLLTEEFRFADFVLWLQANLPP